MIVKWIANGGIIPNCGVAEKGKEIDLPDSVAAEFIKQGKAEKATRAKKEK